MLTKFLIVLTAIVGSVALMNTCSLFHRHFHWDTVVVPWIAFLFLLTVIFAREMDNKNV